MFSLRLAVVSAVLLFAVACGDYSTSSTSPTRHRHRRRPPRHRLARRRRPSRFRWGAEFLGTPEPSRPRTYRYRRRHGGDMGEQRCYVSHFDVKCGWLGLL